MSDFGDSEPEDEWDDSDPYEVKLALLAKIVVNIRDTEQNPFRRQVRTENARRLRAKLQSRLIELRDELYAVNDTLGEL